MSSRYMRRGVSKFYFVPTIAAATLIPTVAEVNAGTILHTQLAEINGFSFANSPIMVPDMSNAFTPQIGGEDNSADSSLTFYELKPTDTIRTSQSKGTAGYVVIAYAGTAGAAIAIADKVDTWPATVTSNAKQYSAGNEAAQYVVSYAMTAVPKFDLAITA